MVGRLRAMLPMAARLAVVLTAAPTMVATLAAVGTAATQATVAT
jgi:hypothetical protein